MDDRGPPNRARYSNVAEVSALQNSGRSRDNRSSRRKQRRPSRSPRRAWPSVHGSLHSAALHRPEGKTSCMIALIVALATATICASLGMDLVFWIGRLSKCHTSSKSMARCIPWIAIVDEDEGMDTTLHGIHGAADINAVQNAMTRLQPTAGDCHQVALFHGRPTCRVIKRLSCLTSNTSTSVQARTLKFSVCDMFQPCSVIRQCRRVWSSTPLLSHDTMTCQDCITNGAL